MTTRPNLRSANLNLAPILRALLRERNVTLAAGALGLSPSATSGALAELRILLKDPLLVRVGRTMRLTPRAEALIGKAELACSALEDLLLDAEFDPASTERTFVVTAPDYLSFLIMPDLMRRLRRSAPGVRVRFVGVPGELERDLTLGGADLSMVALNFVTWAGVSASPVNRDRVVAVVDRSHPLAGTKPTAATLASYPQIDWAPGPGLSGRLAAERGAKDGLLKTSAQFGTNSFTSIPFLVVGTDYVASSPRTLALRMAQLLPLAILDLPSPPRPIETAVVWSTVHDADPAHSWFRAHCARALQSVHAESGLME